MELSEIVFMDFEASALRGGYPVEVGWAWVEGGSVQAESLLISPADKWLGPGFTWDPTAEGIHGLALSRLLEKGVPLTQVCELLNSELQDKIVFFDTGPDGADRHWLDVLFSEAKVKRLFRLGGLAGEVLKAMASQSGLDDEYAAVIAAAAPPINHQAAQDAAHYAWRAAAIHIAAGAPPISDWTGRIPVSGLGRDRV